MRHQRELEFEFQEGENWSPGEHFCVYRHKDRLLCGDVDSISLHTATGHLAAPTKGSILEMGGFRLSYEGLGPLAPKAGDTVVKMRPALPIGEEDLDVWGERPSTPTPAPRFEGSVWGVESDSDKQRIREYLRKPKRKRKTVAKAAPPSREAAAVATPAPPTSKPVAAATPLPSPSPSPTTPVATSAVAQAVATPIATPVETASPTPVQPPAPTPVQTAAPTPVETAAPLEAAPTPETTLPEPLAFAGTTNTDPKWNFTAGANYTFPMIHIQRRLASVIAIGVMPTYLYYPVDEGKLNGVGGLLTLTFMPSGGFKDLWLTFGIGGYQFQARKNGVETFNAPAGLINFGWRWHEPTGLNFGFGVGVNSLLDGRTDAAGVPFSRLLPSMLLDIGFWY